MNLTADDAAVPGLREDRRLRGLPAVQAAAGSLCLSASAVLFLLAGTGPVVSAFYRCALPLPILAVLAVRERQREGGRPVASRAWAAAAGLVLAVNLVLWIHAIADSGAGPATVLGSLQVLFIAGIGWVFRGERPSRLLLVMIPVLLAGVVLVSGMIGGHGTAPHPVAGAAFGLATSATYACFLMILRQTAGQGRHPAGQLFDATVGAAAGALALGLIFGGLQLAVSMRALGWLLVLTLTGGVIGWLLITRSLPRLPATASALILMAEPAGSIVLAYFVLGQRPSLLQVAGAVVVSGGVLVVAVGARPDAPAPPEPRPRAPALSVPPQ